APRGRRPEAGVDQQQPVQALDQCAVHGDLRAPPRAATSPHEEVPGRETAALEKKNLGHAAPRQPVISRAYSAGSTFPPDTTQPTRCPAKPSGASKTAGSASAPVGPAFRLTSL